MEEKYLIMNIPLSLNSKEKLINNWGPEVILKCSCREVPSHSMWGTYPSPTCPLCKTRCVVIFQEWSYVTDGS